MVGIALLATSWISGIGEHEGLMYVTALVVVVGLIVGIGVFGAAFASIIRAGGKPPPKKRRRR